MKKKKYPLKKIQKTNNVNEKNNLNIFNNNQNDSIYTMVCEFHLKVEKIIFPLKVMSLPLKNFYLILL